MPKIPTTLAILSVAVGSLLFPSMTARAEEELPGFNRGETKVFQNEFGEGVMVNLIDPRQLLMGFNIPARDGFKAVEAAAWVALPDSTLTVEEMTTLSQEVGLYSQNETWKIENIRVRADNYEDMTNLGLNKTLTGAMPTFLTSAPYHTVFYAAEYRDVNDIYSLGYFVRGSIDFRSCVRAKRYAKYEVGTCETVMAEDQTFAVVPTGTVLKKASYATWKDIVAEMAEEWMDGAITQINLAEQKKTLGNLDEEDKAKITGALESMKNDAELLGVDFTTYFGDYELRVAALLEDDEQDQETTSSNTGSTGSSFGFGAVTVDDEVDEVLSDLMQEETGDNARIEIILDAESDIDEGGETTEEVAEKVEEAEEESISTEDVEVPKLGGEAKKSWGWLLLVPVIGVLVGVILWSKRQKTGEEN